LLYTYYDKLEIIPFEIEEVSTQQSENPWLKFAGVFRMILTLLRLLKVF